MKGGEAIIKALKEQGVDTIFGYPGGTVIPFYDSLYDDDLNHILVRHEQCAAHAAEGYARASGKVGVCVATSGPGATNLITGIANAYMDSSPIIALTGQVSSNLIGNDAFQEADIMGISMPITKHNYQIKDIDSIPSIIKSSFNIAKTGRPGPVLIDIPKEMQENELTKYSTSLIKTPGYNPTLKGNIKQVKTACKLIAKAKNPMILAGGGVIISGASAELQKFAKTIKAPVVTTLMGKGAVPEDEDYSLGMLGMHGRLVANKNINKADILIAIGTRFSDRTTGKLDEFLPNGTKVIHIDVDPAEIGKNVDVDIPIVGDAKNILKIFNNELKSYKPNNDAVNWFKNLEIKKQELIPRTNYDSVPLMPQRVIREISEGLTEDSIVTTDVGLHQMFAAHYFNVNKPRKFISSGGLGTMGFGFPAAIGAKVACEDDPVLSIVGDGGFLMVCQELATVREYDLPVIVTILNNRKLGMVYQWQSLLYNQRLSETDLGNVPDFVKLAESFNINAEKITQPGETKKAVQKAIKDNEALVLDIEIKKNEFLPMVPAGAGVEEILGEYELAKDYEN
ncbi:acetolactate synthase, large subunit, biosynthetic type [Methanobrevibacter sp. 87.7]|uniref:acetolactate synthase large subunit n=1 Tax=Methanobrevibacter sp. 87.7 TaxID=387957 RepID=UPI000B506331|nr:acetolactate synthase large subunit [Methanobrevibacter sp. 87.7]OWT33729.1 acetolactate synthase, large subunit, biosynthetic type [Methanobrevibacter sp. 87.7]